MDVAALRAEHDRLRAASSAEWKRAGAIIDNLSDEDRSGGPTPEYREAVAESFRLAEEAGKIRDMLLPQEMQEEIRAEALQSMMTGFVRGLFGR